VNAQTLLISEVEIYVCQVLFAKILMNASIAVLALAPWVMPQQIRS
jgi:hypothetical protein